MSTPGPDQKPDTVSLAIADLSVQFNCNHVKLTAVLRDRYRDFLQPQSHPNFIVDIHWIGKDQINSLSEINPDFRDGLLNFAVPGFDGFIDEKNGQGSLTFNSAQPVEEIDYYLRMVFALLAHAAKGVLLHTAGIVRDGKAYLFFGHSGSGKTTVCQVSQDDATILNDDLILLLPDGQGWQAYGTPFWNPTQVQPSAQNAPVTRMYLLVQARKVFTYPLAAGHGLAALIANVPVIPQDPTRSLQLLEILSSIQHSLPISELHFLPDNSFWNVIAP